MRHVLWLWLLVLPACRFSVSPNTNVFECDDGSDCDEGYDCVARIDSTPARCWPLGACVPETCDGLDNDCNGVADDTFQFQSDPAHCGNCTTTCLVGVACVDGACEGF